MDNVTHSLAGLLLADVALYWRASRGDETSRAFRVAAPWVSAIANNLPDLDFVYVSVTPGKLGYLLHHRGHTHTLLGALAAGLLILLVVTLLGRRVAFSRSESRWLLALALLGPLVHIGLDFMNSYGVHPFWPIDSRWVYADVLFILEPWFWVFAVPPLIARTRSWLLRVALAIVLAGGLGLAWVVELAPWGVALALTAAAALAIAAVVRFGDRGRVWLGAGGFCAVIAVFTLASRVAYARATDIAADPHAADARRVDTVLTPAPANPLCFSALVVDTQGDRYRLRVATVAPFPALLAAERCRSMRGESNLAMTRIGGGSAAVRWEREWSAPLAELVALNRDNCQVAALLRFMRVPYWQRIDPETVFVGDLRYDRDEQEDFAEMRVPRAPVECPPNVPPWRPPRHDVLD